MLAVLNISGELKVVTGLHIGGSSAFSAIGAVDNPIIKDTVSGLPMIPGSSLKGKMRALLARQYNKTIAVVPDDDDECLTDLFGCSQKGKAKNSRVIFNDMLMDNWEEFKEKGLTSKTEIKFENSISRTTAVANPRQTERAFRGSSFPLKVVYELYGDEIDEKIIKKDFEILAMGFKLLQLDYLGGSGSRGYGKVKFEDLDAEISFGDVSGETLDSCRELLSEVSHDTTV